MEEEPTDPDASAPAVETPNLLGARNAGDPILLENINFHGVSAEAARGGDKVNVWTRLILTSDQALFHKIVPNLVHGIEVVARNNGSHVSLSHARTFLLVMRPDNTGELWVDTAAVVVDSRLKRTVEKAGTVLFESDIADVTGMWFPFVEVKPEDRILCVFREGWRFAMFFDFNPTGTLDVHGARRDLGTLYRQMKYADLYATLAHEETFFRLIESGWFPFLELMSGEFKRLVDTCAAGFDLDEVEGELLEKFDETRVENMFGRWMARPHLKEKEVILRSAMNAFKSKDAVASIKIVLTEIEGVLSEAYFRARNERTHRTEKLLEFVVSAAEQRAGGTDTLFFPVEFATYLRDHTYAGFTPGSAGKAGSRHAVGHGALKSEQYTQARALQALLTLDQLAFYT